MLGVFRRLVLGSALMVLASCTYYQPEDKARQSAAAELAFAQSDHDALGDELQSQAAAQRDDWKLSADFAERSYKQRPDLVNEFNLATAYQRTGRVALAIPLYIDLVERGDHTAAVPLLKYDGTWPKQKMQPTLSEEAADRLRRLGVEAGLRTRNPAPSARTAE